MPERLKLVALEVYARDIERLDGLWRSWLRMRIFP